MNGRSPQARFPCVLQRDIALRFCQTQKYQKLQRPFQLRNKALEWWFGVVIMFSDYVPRPMYIRVLGGIDLYDPQSDFRCMAVQVCFWVHLQLSQRNFVSSAQPPLAVKRNLPASTTSESSTMRIQNIYTTLL